MLIIFNIKVILYRIYRDECSIEATNVLMKKEFLNSQLCKL